MEHRNALIVDAELTEATGYAERDTALEMLDGSHPRPDVEPSRATRATTPKISLPMSASSGSRRTSRRTRPANAPRSTGAPPAMPDMPSVNGSANGSRNRSAG